MRRLLVWLAVSTGCWESGTEAPPLPTIVSPLADAGGRLAPKPATTDSGAAPAPALIRFDKRTFSGARTTIDFEGMGFHVGDDHLLVVALVTQERHPTSVRLGTIAFGADAFLNRGKLHGSIWSTRTAASTTQRIDIAWDAYVSDGLLVWTEWAGLDQALPASVIAGENNQIDVTNRDAYVAGTILLAVAVADPAPGAPKSGFREIYTSNNRVWGISLAYATADGKKATRATFATEPETMWSAAIVPYAALTSSGSAP